MQKKNNVKMTKPKRYVEIEAKNDILEAFVIGFQNVFYIIASWFFGYMFAKSGYIVYIFTLIVPIIFKVTYDTKERKVKIRIFR